MEAVGTTDNWVCRAPEDAGAKPSQKAAAVAARHTDSESLMVVFSRDCVGCDVCLILIAAQGEEDAHRMLFR